VHKNLGLVLLLNGDFGEGWIEYNYRMQADNLPMRGGNLEIWRGQPVGDGAVYFFAEQGIGDEILYASMLPDLVTNKIRVIWDSDARLIPILERSFPGIRFIPRQTTVGPPAPDAVAQLPVGTLGQIFRRGYEYFPREPRAYLKADSDRSAMLRLRLRLGPGEKLIGMSWVSKNIAFGRHKSTTLDDWAEIMATPGVKFVDLQYGDTSAEREAFRKKYGDRLAHIDGLDLRDDMEGMFALTAACDHVITVSNTTAHVAGALGIPTWVLVPLGGGKLWYWGTAEKNWTPWYPNIEIIRQVKHGEWDSTLSLTTERLRKHLEGSTPINFTG
jgi:ADP-heptose:LPS heptosyltransferase